MDVVGEGGARVPASTFALRFDSEPERPDYPWVTILVDGRDLADLAGGYVGFDPTSILGADSPLLPEDPPQRVAVLRCTCGEPGCGCVAPVIGREGDAVVWRDARDYTGVFVSPGESVGSLDGGSPVGLPELRFDAARYEAEVRRASADRSWETPRRETARLLQEYLHESADELRALGYNLTWVACSSPVEGAFAVSLLDGRRHQLVVAVEAPERSPAEWAGDLAERLLRTAPGEWHVTFRGNFALPEAP